MQEWDGKMKTSFYRLTIVASLWGLWYALYRGYYALGGTGFLFGTLASPSEFRRINAIGAAIIFLLALLPIVMLRLWHREKWRYGLLILCWIIAVGACAHAVIDITQRILSLFGYLQVHYPPEIWSSVNTKKSDLQDIFFNEPWFLAEGLLFATLGRDKISQEIHRRQWIATIGIAVAIAFVLGILSATGVIGKIVVD